MTKLMSDALKGSINALSHVLYYDTWTRNLHGNKPSKDKTVINYTNNQFRVMIGSMGKRKEMLKKHNIPGHKISMWQMDSPVTPYWEGRVMAMAKDLGVTNALDVYEE